MKTDSADQQADISDIPEQTRFNKIADKLVNQKKKIKKENTRNLHSTRKNTTNNWWLEIVLAPYKNGISENFKFAWYSF